jgi:hypothetical protein
MTRCGGMSGAAAPWVLVSRAAAIHPEGANPVQVISYPDVSRRQADVFIYVAASDTVANCHNHSSIEPVPGITSGQRFDVFNRCAVPGAEVRKGRAVLHDRGCPPGGGGGGGGFHTRK